MLAALPMTSCPNLAVPAEVMEHVVQVESGANPYAIGVVGGELVRQPRSLDEAVATARMLDEQGYDFSLGLAQVNRRNLARYGLTSYRQAFDTCANLTTGARILAECYIRSGEDWGKALSCYYSGNFVTGYRDGYVQKVYASMQRAAAYKPAHGAQPIQLAPTAGADSSGVPAHRLPPVGSAGYRVAIRSVALDTVGTLAVQAVAAAPPTPQAADPGRSEQAVVRGETPLHPLPQAAAMAATASPASAPASAIADEIFRPIVRGPGDLMAAGPGAGVSATPTSAPDAAATTSTEARDAAFVF